MMRMVKLKEELKGILIVKKRVDAE